MLKDTDFLPAILAHAPDVLEEVQGIAEGSAQPFDLLLAAQLMDEEWAYRSSARADLGAGGGQKCSSVAVSGSGNTVFIGQNMDLGGYTDGHQIALRIAPDGPRPGTLIFSISSMVALMGVNSRGIGVCVNAITQLPARRHGLPVAFMIRKLLQAHTLADSVETVTTIPHATPQHYVLADADSIRSFEVLPPRALEYYPPDATGVLHTNHPLEESLQPYGSYPNTVARLKS